MCSAVGEIIRARRAMYEGTKVVRCGALGMKAAETECFNTQSAELSGVRWAFTPPNEGRQQWISELCSDNDMAR